VVGVATAGIDYLAVYDAFSHANTFNSSATTSLLGIGTTTPFSQFSVSTSSQSSEFTSLFSVASTTGASLFNVLGGGNVGIGTTTPGTLFSINGSANFTTGTSTILGNGFLAPRFNATATSTLAGVQIGTGGLSIGTLSLLKATPASSASPPRAPTTSPPMTPGPTPAVSVLRLLLLLLELERQPHSVSSRFQLHHNRHQTLPCSQSLQRQSVATSSFTPSVEFTTTGTIGALVGGANSTLALAANGVALTKIAQIAANTILGNNTGATGNVVAFATSTLGIAISDTSGTLALNRGGTATTTFQNGGALFYNSTLGTISQSATTTNFLWEETNKRLSLGSSSPYAQLSIFAGQDFTSKAASTLFAIGSTSAGTATSTLFNVLSSGSVGVGSTTPWALFSIGSTSQTNVPEFAVQSNATTSLLVSSAGVVGIATSSTATATSSGIVLVVGNSPDYLRIERRRVRKRRRHLLLRKTRHGRYLHL
jgi:hypothetical protein